MRAAASCDDPILRPTRRFTRWPLLTPPRDGSVGSESFGSESWRLSIGVFPAAGSCSVAASSDAAFGFRPSESSFFQNGAPFSFGAAATSSAFGALGLRESESSFFQNGAPFSFGARAAFSAFGALGLRETERSFFQNGFLAGASRSGGSSAAGTGGWTVTAGAAARGAGGGAAP